MFGPNPSKIDQSLGVLATGTLAFSSLSGVLTGLSGVEVSSYAASDMKHLFVAMAFGAGVGAYKGARHGFTALMYGMQNDQQIIDYSIKNHGLPSTLEKVVATPLSVFNGAIISTVGNVFASAGGYLTSRVVYEIGEKITG